MRETAAHSTLIMRHSTMDQMHLSLLVGLSVLIGNLLIGNFLTPDLVDQVSEKRLGFNDQ